MMWILAGFAFHTCWDLLKLIGGMQNDLVDSMLENCKQSLLVVQGIIESTSDDWGVYVIDEMQLLFIYVYVIRNLKLQIVLLKHQGFMLLCYWCITVYFMLQFSFQSLSQ